MTASVYQLKSDPHSSHAVILRFLGEGRGRRALDVGAADGFLAELLTRQGWQVTAL
jgi:2-polyprenyl-3-methyl-5-hydroxy-6-metoxy-1,4-benzoquinol methylase